MKSDHIGQAEINLLLVGRDDISLLLHRRIAEGTGFFKSIRSATSGRNALHHIQMAAKGSVPFPDIVLLDLNVPVMNGIKLLKIFQSSAVEPKQNISFVVLTPSVSDRLQAIAHSLGASALLSKPLSEETFTSTIRRIYSQRHEPQMVH